MATHEDRIRDELAKRLDLLETDLLLVDKNYHLANTAGTRGFVDIIARDVHGAFVVIELKRSDHSAREALHEVAKYVELLKRTKGIGASQIRAIVVSTEWDELLVPFSHFKRAWPYELNGYALELGSDETTPVSAAAIAPLEEVMERGLTAVHAFITGLTAKTLPAMWRTVSTVLASVGADDVVGVPLTHPKRGHGLYLGIGRMTPSDPRSRALDYLADDIPDDSIDARGGCVLEYRALTALTEGVPTARWNVAYPEKFSTLTQQGGWKIRRLLRAGVFGEQGKLYGDSDLCEVLAGDQGLGEVRFTGSSRPSQRLHWEDFRRRARTSLMGNPLWKEIVEAWFDEAMTQAPALDARIHVYNPCDLVTTLVYGWEDQLERYLPELEAAIAGVGPEGRYVLGMLTWSGVACDVGSAFRSVYADDWDWAMAKTTGTVWESDLELIAAFELGYTVVEFAASGPHQLMVEGGALSRIPMEVDSSGTPNPAGRWPLSLFVRNHSNEITALVNRLRAQTLVDRDGGTQLFISGPDDPGIEDPF